MIHGHGDDLHAFPEGTIRINMSSNIPACFPHEGLYAYLAQCLPHICHYPQADAAVLEEAIARHHGVDRHCVLATSGATEAIYLIAQAYARRRSAILAPTFSEYEDACHMHHHDVSHLYQLPTRVQADIMWLCNPNNPTGVVVPPERIREWSATHPDTLFVVDQSYAHFTTTPLISPSEMLPNVLILHSMTKEYGVPGLRLGYITAPQQILDDIRPLRLPWSISQIATDAALYLLAHTSEYKLDVEALLRERQRVASALQATRMVEVWPSDTHILLVKLRTTTASALKDIMAWQYGILIRDASNFTGLDASFIRIAVQQDPAHNDAFLAAFDASMALLNEY